MVYLGGVVYVLTVKALIVGLWKVSLLLKI